MELDHHEKTGTLAQRQPKDDEFAKFLPTAHEGIIACLKSIDEKVKLAASKWVYDQVYGKASQPIEGSSGDNIALNLAKAFRAIAEGKVPQLL